MTETSTKYIIRREQLNTLWWVRQYRPLFTVGTVIASVFAALLEAVGLNFILPIVRIIQLSSGPTTEADGIMLALMHTYQILGAPLTLRIAVAGVSLILTVRWTSASLMRWLRGLLFFDYDRGLQTHTFGHEVKTKNKYFNHK